MPDTEVLASMTAHYGALSSRAWGEWVARAAAFYGARLHRSMHELDEECAELEGQLGALRADRHELEHHHAAWTALAATPGATPAAERGARYYALWDALPGYITEAAPGDAED